MKSRADRIKHRIATGELLGTFRCSIPGCARLTMLAAGIGLARFHCRYHVQFRARHGSHWHPTYQAAEIEPYRKAADLWIGANLELVGVQACLRELDALISTNRPPEPAQNLRGMPAEERADIALKRLGRAGIAPRRILATAMGLWALIEEDAGSHRVKEFRDVQIAKALHRLASGTHRRWEMQAHANGPVSVIELHAYPRSAGRVLRVIGAKIGSACDYVARTHIEVVCGIKRERFGPHPSTLPGWKPLWERERLRKAEGANSQVI